MTLFEVESKQRWTGSRELVLASSLVCAWCGPTYDVSYAQPALFRFGGYGALEGRRIRSCRCGAVRVVSKFTLNPRRAERLLV